MLRTLLCYGGFMGSLILKMPKKWRMDKLKKQMLPDEFSILAEQLTGDWAAARMRQTGAKVTVNGLENIPEGAVLFVSNHQSNYDIPVFMSYIRKPKGFVAKIETKKVPLLKYWMQFMDCIFIDRSDLRQQAKTIIEGIKQLQNGHSMVLFPEGTRSKGGPVSEFKAGSFKLATKSKVPIIPVTLNGTYKIMEANGWRIKPADVTLTVHPPIETAELTREDEVELCDKVREIIISALPKEVENENN